MQNFKDLQTLERSLPERFPFYHLGEIMTDPGESQYPLELHDPVLLASHSALGIRLQGDVRALLLILVEEGLDLSIYSEVANILASRLANHLSEEDGTEVVISAPSLVGPQRLKSLLSDSAKDPAAMTRRYFHRNGTQVVPVHAVLLMDRSASGGGNA